MTKEEIEELKGLAASMGLYDDKNPCKRAVILGKAIKALEQETVSKEVYDHEYSLRKEFEIKIDKLQRRLEEQKPCEDVISRQAVLDIDFKRIILTTAKPSETIEQKVKSLPPVNPQPKIGHWIEYEVEDRWVTCSVCGYEWGNKKENFCSNCGARMVDSQEREETE